MGRRKFEVKHKMEGKMVLCAARGCCNAVKWGSRVWTDNWTSLWVVVDGEGYSFDSCSSQCARRIEAGEYKKKALESAKQERKLRDGQRTDCEDLP